MGLLDDARQRDEAFDVLTGPGIPIPPGFDRFEFARAGWRYRVGDAEHQALSLLAHTADLSGLAQVPAHALWKLACLDRHVTDAEFDFVVRFDALKELDLSHTSITDAAATAMHTLQKLTWLSVSSCAITDGAMEHLAALRALEHLDISATHVTDDGLRALAFHPALRVLNIRDSKITGEALAPLLTLPELQQVWMTPHQHRHAHRFADESAADIPLLTLAAPPSG